jgi:hypothetical protein
MYKDTSFGTTDLAMTNRSGFPPKPCLTKAFWGKQALPMAKIVAGREPICRMRLVHLADGGSLLQLSIAHPALGKHSLTVPGFCAIVRQSMRTIAILYDSVL